MTAYLPDLADLAGLLLTWAVAALLLLAGAGLGGKRHWPEMQIAMGWGGLCLLLTCWAVVVPAYLAIPAAAFAVASLAVLALPARRPAAAAWRALGRMLAVSLPLWLVMAPIRPSQPDTWLNLLPNAFYLVDHGFLPGPARPDSYSFLPLAPYDTQFLSYLGSLAWPDYPAGGMSLMNLMLLMIGGLLLARALGPEQPADAAPSWAATAGGMLLATLLNAGFVPRVNLAAYGETGLAVTALIAAWLIVRDQPRLAAGEAVLKLAWPLGLVLAAMVNTKQSGIGLVAALFVAALVLGWAERAVPRAALLRWLAAALVPPLALYGIWRIFVLATFPAAELQPLPLLQWQWGNIPEILLSILAAIIRQPIYFTLVALALAALPHLLRRDGWTAATRWLALHAGVFVAYNGFLMLTYIGHFSGTMSTEAHSFFRYNTHLSLVLIAALIAAARAYGIDRAILVPASRGRAIGVATVVLALLVPLGFIQRLRFDLVMPQPLVWNLGKRLAARLAPDARLALLLPGDNGSVDIMLKSELRFSAPRRPGLDFLTLDSADAAAFQQAAQKGYRTAFVSCAPAGLDGVPAGNAALLRFDGEAWHPAEVWPYPANAMAKRWQYILSWEPLCRAPSK